MDQTVVTASTGRQQGSRSSRRLRAEGQLPGVIYGLDRDPIAVSVVYNDLRDALKVESGMNTVIDLDLGEDKARETVIVRAVQRDPIRRTVTHADFMRVDPTVPITVKVPVRLVGEAEEVANEGGNIEQKVYELEVLVPPLDIPSEILADITEMTLDSRISVGDLPLPVNATTLTDDDISVVISVLPRAAILSAEEEEADLLGEDGEEGEGDAADSGDGADDSADGGDE